MFPSSQDMNPSDIILPENDLNINIEPDIIFEVPDLLNEYPMYNINIPNVVDGLPPNQSRNTTYSLPIRNNQPASASASASASSLDSMVDQSFDDLLITMGKNYIYR